MSTAKPNIFRASEEYPYHVSVGVVVANDRGEILAHHFDEQNVHGVIVKDLYILIRESLEPGERLEQALLRGLQEECGISGRIISCIGSLESYHHDRGYQEWKTTVYFLVESNTSDFSQRVATDFESHSKLAYYKPEFLIAKMKGQG